MARGGAGLVCLQVKLAVRAVIDCSFKRSWVVVEFNGLLFF